MIHSVRSNDMINVTDQTIRCWYTSLVTVHFLHCFSLQMRSPCWVSEWSDIWLQLEEGQKQCEMQCFASQYSQFDILVFAVSIIFSFFPSHFVYEQKWNQVLQLLIFHTANYLVRKNRQTPCQPGILKRAELCPL